MLHEHRSLEESIASEFVVYRHPNYSISYRYYNWCTLNAKPYVEIAPQIKYASVVMDLCDTSDEGFSAETGYEILHFILDQSLKPRSMFSVGPKWVSAYVSVQSADAVAKFLYRRAMDEGIIFSQDELFKRYFARYEEFGNFLDGKSAFMRINAEVRPSELARLRTKKFWQSLLL
jgi:hypothetical protein